MAKKSISDINEQMVLKQMEDIETLVFSAYTFGRSLLRQLTYKQKELSDWSKVVSLWYFFFLIAVVTNLFGKQIRRLSPVKNRSLYCTNSHYRTLYQEEQCCEPYRKLFEFREKLNVSLIFLSCFTKLIDSYQHQTYQGLNFTFTFREHNCTFKG